MKKSLFTTILVVAAIVVWGLIVWRVWSRIADKKTEKSSVNQPITERKTEKDTLILSYKNPFFQTKKAEGSKSVVSRRLTVEPPKPKIHIYPDFSFKGVIKGVGGERILIDRSGQQIIVRHGDSVGVFKIALINRDSLRVNNADTTYTLTREL